MADPILVITGSRDLTDPEPIRKVIEEYRGRPTLYHGGQRGADQLAAEIALELGWEVIVVEYLAELGPQGGPVRNAEMLCLAIRRAQRQKRPLRVLAFPRWNSRGTKNCVALARMLRVATNVYPQAVNGG